METACGESRLPNICATRLFDALTLTPCNLELARALHVAGHASHVLGRGLNADDLIAGLEREGGDMRIEPIGGTPAGNFIVSLQRRCHRILELASIDIYRIAGGKIAEHWQVVQPAGAILAKAVAPTRRSATQNITSKAIQEHPEKPDMRENMTC